MTPANDTRPLALLVASSDAADGPSRWLVSSRFTVERVDDPYAAVARVLQAGDDIRAIVVSLQGVYPEELSFLRTIAGKLADVAMYAVHADGRQSALDAAQRHGVSGVLSESGLRSLSTDDGYPSKQSIDGDSRPDEPILSADELRALLQEHPALGPSL